MINRGKRLHLMRFDYVTTALLEHKVVGYADGATVLESPGERVREPDDSPAPPQESSGETDRENSPRVGKSDAESVREDVEEQPLIMSAP
jgi:hypothetical protein